MGRRGSNSVGEGDTIMIRAAQPLFEVSDDLRFVMAMSAGGQVVSLQAALGVTPEELAGFPTLLLPDDIAALCMCGRWPSLLLMARLHCRHWPWAEWPPQSWLAEHSGKHRMEHTQLASVSPINLAAYSAFADTSSAQGTMHSSECDIARRHRRGVFHSGRRCQGPRRHGGQLRCKLSAAVGQVACV